MSYKCRICGSNDVENPGDVCELCAIGQDPYAAAMGFAQTPGSGSDAALQADRQGGNGYMEASGTMAKGKSRKILIGGGTSLSNRDPYGNNIAVQEDAEPQVQVYHAGQAPVQQGQSAQTVATAAKGGKPLAAVSAGKSKEPVTTGITKNISTDTQQRPFLQKLFQSFFSGIPFTLDDDVTMFQVFPDYTGTALNAMGNACDQVVVYGKVNNGSIAENNEVEVYGHRDSHNNVIAAKIKNKASGTTVTPDRVISAAVIRVLVFAVLALIAAAGLGLGATGLVWAIVLILCLTNLPTVLKILGVLFGAVFSIFKKR